MQRTIEYLYNRFLTGMKPTQQDFRDLMDSFFHKADLAVAYFPTVSLRTAQRLFRRELQHNRGLWQALHDADYRPTQKRLTPRQVQLIFQYLGEP